jgi:hypothetical protein
MSTSHIVVYFGRLGRSAKMPVMNRFIKLLSLKSKLLHIFVKLLIAALAV